MWVNALLVGWPCGQLHCGSTASGILYFCITNPLYSSSPVLKPPSEHRPGPVPHTRARRDVVSNVSPTPVALSNGSQSATPTVRRRRRWPFSLRPLLAIIRSASMDRFRAPHLSSRSLTQELKVQFNKRTKAPAIERRGKAVRSLTFKSPPAIRSWAMSFMVEI